MNLSEAIREGSKITPQITGEAITGKGTCALGAALIICGRMVPYRSVDNVMIPRTTPMSESGFTVQVPADWMPALKAERPCPGCGEELEMYILIPHLNDKHLWTRERIADFVETVEEVVQQPALSYCGD